MQQLSQVLQSLPVDHPAKIGYQTWPCGDHIVNGLCFVNGPRSMRQLIISCFHKKDNPHFGSSEFLKFKDEVLTYDQAWQHISALGAALVNDFGIRGGDRVAISMRNYPEWIIAFLAIMCVGGVVCPLNSLWKESEMEYGLADSGTKVLFCDAERLVYAKSALSKLQIPAIVCRGSGGSGGSGGATYTNTYTNVVGRRRGETLPSYPSSLTIDSTAAIFYTSGSTGNPKGVCQTHRGMTNQIYQPIALRMLQGNSTPLKQQAQQAIICPVPLFHVTGCHHLFLSALTSGSRLILMYKWDAGEALKLIERERPTSWTGVPTQVQDLMEHPDFAKYDTSSLNRIGGGGAPTPVSQVEKVKNKFKGGGSAGNGYGLTETNGGICTIFGDDYRKRPTSCGQPLPLVEVIVVIAGEQNTEDGSYKFIATPNTRGELLIRSALVMKEYWNKPKKNQESLVAVDNGKGGGWFRTGDIAELDSENYIYIVDRLKDLIIRGGENVSCAEVESAFYSHPNVLECAAFGMKDERLGERVGICIVLKPSTNDTTPSKNDFIKHVKDGLARFKTPLAKDMFIQKTQLDRGATGKILKRAIRDRFNAASSKL